MAFVEIDKDKILEELKKTEYEEIVNAVNEFKQKKEFNPLKWDEFKTTIVLLGNILEKVIITVEKVAKSLTDIASGQAKLEAAVEFIDDVVKLPWYLELIDKPFLKLIISLLVDQLNKRLGHTWDSPFKD